MDERDYMAALEGAQERAYYDQMEQDYFDKMQHDQEQGYDASHQEYEAMQREQSAAYDAMQRAQYDEYRANEAEREILEKMEREHNEWLHEHGTVKEMSLARLERQELDASLEQAEKLAAEIDDMQDEEARLEKEGKMLLFKANWELKIARLKNALSGIVPSILFQRGTPGDSAKQTKRFFRTIELFACIIPSKTRKECFEPAFDDAKDDFLQNRRKFNGQIERRLLTLCFCAHTLGLFLMSFWALCSEKAKNALWAAFGGFVVWFRGH